MKHYYVALILLSWCRLQANGQVIALTGSGKAEALGQMTHFVDETDTMSVSTVRQMNFEPLPDSEKSPGLGFVRRTHWFRMEVANQSDQSEWNLEIPYAPLDRIDVYVFAGGPLPEIHKIGGDTFPIATRDLPHRHPIFRLTIPQGETRTIYLRISTISSVQVPVVFWTPARFQVANYHTQLINGLFYGAMFIMTLYQLF